MKLFAVAAILVSAVLVPTSAAAQDDARSLFERGVALGDEGRWAEALESFERSYELAPRASTQFNIASTHMRLGHAVEAREVVREYLERSEVASRPRRRQAAESLLELAESQITELSIYVSPETATVEIDGRPSSTRGAVRQVSLDAGEHVFLIAAEGFEGERRRERLRPGEQSLRVSLSRTTDTSSAAPRITPDVGESRADTSDEGDEGGGGVLSSPWFWILTAALVIGGGVTAAILLTQGSGEPNGGNTGIVLEALSW